MLLDKLQKQAEKQDQLSLDDLLKTFHGRAQAPLLFTLAILLVSPLGGVPMVAPIFSVLIACIAGQAAVSNKLWLPQWLLQRHVRASKAKTALKRVIPWTKKMESFTRPRLSWAASRGMARLCNVVITIIGLSIAGFGLIPGGLILPGLAIMLLSIGQFHHDGIWVLAGLTICAIAFGLLGYAWYASWI